MLILIVFIRKNLKRLRVKWTSLFYGLLLTYAILFFLLKKAINLYGTSEFKNFHMDVNNLDVYFKNQTSWALLFQDKAEQSTANYIDPKYDVLFYSPESDENLNLLLRLINNKSMYFTIYMWVKTLNIV